MTTNNDRWIGVAEALKLMEPLPSAGLGGHRVRLAGWIIDDVVRLRALEMVGFEARGAIVQEPLTNESQIKGDEHRPITAPQLWTQPPMDKITASNIEFNGADIAVLRQAGIFDPLAPWWETEEITIRHPVPGIDERQTFYGIQVHVGDLAKRLAVAGLPGFVVDTSASRADKDERARGWVRNWLQKPGGSTGLNKCWDEFKLVPDHKGIQREGWFDVMFKDVKRELGL